MDKIFITGATGFIGSHLTELCIQRGFDIIAYDRYNSNNHWGWLEKSEYKRALKSILPFFEKNEDYVECSNIANLIKKL